MLFLTLCFFFLIIIVVVSSIGDVQGPPVTLGFLGAFAKLRKATTSFVMSVCLPVHPSVRPYGTTRLKLDGFSSNLIYIFRKSAETISSFSKT